MTTQRILVVDDDRNMLLLLSRLLQKAGYAVVTGQDATQAVMSAHRDRPDLILTDIMMPSGGGLSILDRLKLSTKTQIIPVIVLTGSDDPQIEARALAAGAIRVFRKPFDGGELLRAVRAAIGADG